MPTNTGNYLDHELISFPMEGMVVPIVNHLRQPIRCKPRGMTTADEPPTNPHAFRLWCAGVPKEQAGGYAEFVQTYRGIAAEEFTDAVYHLLHTKEDTRRCSSMAEPSPRKRQDARSSRAERLHNEIGRHHA